MAKRNKKKDYQKRAERRQRQYDLCHSEEAFEKAREKRSSQKPKMKKPETKKSDNIEVDMFECAMELSREWGYTDTSLIEVSNGKFVLTANAPHAPEWLKEHTYRAGAMKTVGNFSSNESVFTVGTSSEVVVVPFPDKYLIPMKREALAA